MHARTEQHAPRHDRAAIRSHVEMIHALASATSAEGILTLTRIDGTGKTNTERFAIGDVETMVNSIDSWASHPNLNLYAPWAIFRKDLPRHSKGSEEHVVQSLAFGRRPRRRYR